MARTPTASVCVHGSACPLTCRPKWVWVCVINHIFFRFWMLDKSFVAIIMPWVSARTRQSPTCETARNCGHRIQRTSSPPGTKLTTRGEVCVDIRLKLKRNSNIASWRRHVPRIPSFFASLCFVPCVCFVFVPLQQRVWNVRHSVVDERSRLQHSDRMRVSVLRVTTQACTIDSG